MPGEVRVFTPTDAFNLIRTAVRQGRRIVPLLGSGISIDAGIPTSRFLSDYIVTVSGLARSAGWQNFREFFRKKGWPHRHDVWADWLAQYPGADYQTLSKQFDEL